MAVTEQISEQAYCEIVLRDPDITWELHEGRLREKPAMTWDHNDALSYLGGQLMQQLDRSEYRVHISVSRVRRSPANVYMPDIIVVPTRFGERFRGRPNLLEVHAEPLPLIVEVWSPSTGDYDVDAKLPEYQKRGDLEIWRLHPYDRTLTIWRRHPDGSYEETVYHGGTVRPAALPGVTVDLDALWD